MSRLQEQIQDLDIQSGAVFSKTEIRKGTKYGPFVGKFFNEPHDRRFAWEVSENDFIILN